MSVWRWLFAHALDKGDSPLVIFKYLAKKWAVPESPQEFTARHSLRSNIESTAGDVSNTRFSVIKALGDLVLRGTEGLNKLALLAANEDGLVSVLHYFFQVGESAYKDGPVELFAIHVEIPSSGLPAIVRLEEIHFASYSSFMGTL